MKHYIEYGKRDVFNSKRIIEKLDYKIKGSGYSLFSTASNPEEYLEYSQNAYDKIKGVDLRK